MRNRLGILLLALAIVPFSAPTAGQAGDAPSLELLGDQVDLAELEGRVVYVDFWASWCAPCLKSFPWMAKLHEARASDGLVILAVNVDREDAAAERFLAKHPAPFRILRDPEGKIAGAFDLKAMPTAFAFDRNGEFAWKHEGFRDDEASEVEVQLDALMHSHGEGSR